MVRTLFQEGFYIVFFCIAGWIYFIVWVNVNSHGQARENLSVEAQSPERSGTHFF